MKGLQYRRLLMLGCLCLLYGIFRPVKCVADEPVAGLLVLRNGNVIDGKMIRLADYFLVEKEHGQLQVRVDQVEMFCLTLDEAYERRRGMRTGSTADSHLELAKWCLRHDLFEYASRELIEARATDPHHRRLLMLERRLNQRMIQKAKVPKLLSSKKVTPVTHEIDSAMLDQAPQWARALFVRKIQPMLVKSCTSAGCHQNGTTSQWQMNRLAVLGAGHPEATKYNLVSVLQQIDLPNATESPILRFAEMAHGAGASQAGVSKPLQPHQMQMLRAWVEQLSMNNGGKFETAKVEQTSLTTVRSSSIARLGERYRHAQDISELRSSQQQSSRERSDPFDPSIFNRIHSTRQSEKKKSKQPPESAKKPLLPASELRPE